MDEETENNNDETEEDFEEFGAEEPEESLPISIKDKRNEVILELGGGQKIALASDDEGMGQLLGWVYKIKKDFFTSKTKRNKGSYYG